MAHLAIKWPNGLGVDIGHAEIWRHKDCFRVFTPTKVLRVPYSITTNPETALALCEEQGLSRTALDDMEYREAAELFSRAIPAQEELF